MKCGKTEELVQWTVDAILENPERTILVATSNADEGRLVIQRIAKILVDDHDDKIDGWKFGSRIRTSEGGYIDLFSGYADRLMRGYNPDRVFVSEACPQRIIEAGQWLEKKEKKG